MLSTTGTAGAGGGAISVTRPGGTRVRRNVSGTIKTAVRGRLKVLAAELDRRLVTSAGYTVGDAVAGWRTVFPAGRSGPAACTGRRRARCWD